MVETRTGLDPWLGLTGTDYAHELIRQASRVVSELSEEATSGIPRVISIIRKTQSVAADTALGIPATWQAVAGLTDLQANYFQPSAWDAVRPAQTTEITEAKRTLLIADVPAQGGVSADRILLTDKVQVDDPEFGVVDLAIKSVAPVRGTGLIHIEAAYVRDRAA